MEETEYVTDTYGNIIQATRGNVSSGFVNIPEYNRITSVDISQVIDAKIEAQKKIYEAIFDSEY